jgi:hypothetical protein
MSVADLQKSSCAFVASNFGFGPVSKAATLAEEIKRRFPKTEIHFFGNGIAARFAKQSKSFDCLIEAEVDDAEEIKHIIPVLKNYKTVFSVLNLPLLPRWRKSFGKLFFVDSLAWMWKAPPAGIENVAVYFVQDYLVPPERIENWKSLFQVTTIPPIVKMPKDISATGETANRKNRLLVNFSGCSNQFVSSRVYEHYAATLLSLILEEGFDRFEKIEVCVNQELAEKLQKSFRQPFLKIGQLPHEEFLRKLAATRFLLTAPGITTTLEAVALNTPLGFLLPQNDSQAVMSELYRRQFDESATMAFSRFDEKLAFPQSLGNFSDLHQPVELAVARMSLILNDYQAEIKRFLAEMLGESVNNTTENLKKNIRHIWKKTGQEAVVEKVFGIIK